MIAPRPPIIVTLLAVAAAAPASTQRAPLERLLRRDTLDNGLQVIVVENHAAPLATVLLAVRTGAFTQQPGEEGLAHLYEHLLFRTYRGDPSAFGQEASRLNAEYNGTTSDEVVTYYLMLPSAKTTDAIRLLGELASRARFRAADLSEEKRIVLDEIERLQSDPEGALERSVRKYLWGDTWYRRDTGGDPASLERITLERLGAAYRRYYVPNNSALIVTGDVSPSVVFTAARRHFGRWERGADPFPPGAPAPHAALGGSRATLMRNDVLDVTILVLLHGPSLRADTAATYASDVLFEVLNDRSSAFQQRLVESGLFQSVSGGYQTLNDVGPIAFRARTTSADVRPALLALLGELDDPEMLAGLTTEELTIAKKRRRLAAALTLEQTAALAPALAQWWASAGIDYYLGYHERMNAQTLDDLRRFAEAYVLGKPRVIGVLGPPRVIDSLAAFLGAAPGGRR